MFRELGLLLHVAVLTTITGAISQHPILIVVSYDAFRHDYMDDEALVPHMVKLRSQGAYADYMINVFPTKTFPNHHSIATGLYPEVHGVIGNSYYNVSEQQQVNISYEMFHQNDKVVPIWRRNQDMGDGRYSGCMMWPGCIYPYQGRNCTYAHNWAPGIDWYKRIDKVIQWIMDPKRPANLVMVYFEEPDTHGHAFGPNSEVVRDLLRKLDNVTKYLDDQLHYHNLSNKVNVVHLSDHGMTAVKYKNLINVTQHLKPDSYVMTGATPILQITPKPGQENDVYNALKKASAKKGHFKVYKKSEYLPRWQYRDNPRAPPMLVIADIGYGLDDLITLAPLYAKKYKFNVTDEWEFGVHGYDYTHDEMHPFFMARGPKFRHNHRVAAFNTVDLFNLFCEILEISPTDNNGTMDNVRGLLVNGHLAYSLTSVLIIIAGGVVIALILIGCAAMITLMMIKRQQSITTTAALNKRFPQTFQASVEAQHLLEPEEA